MRTLLSAVYARVPRVTWTFLSAARAACVLLIVSAEGKVFAQAQAPSVVDTIALRWIQDAIDTNRWSVRVSGLSAATLKDLQQTQRSAEDWHKLLPVSVEIGSLLHDVGLPPMLGRYEVAETGIIFTPQFPLEPGVSYRATLWPGRLPGSGNAASKAVTTLLELPRLGATPSTVVAQVYPTADVVPENLLKFYLHFSAPMSRGHVYDHIQLRNQAGEQVELPFLELDEELWNPQMTRLTLFIDPGRIKRGVTPLEEVGPALEEGKRFTLLIDQKWKDSRGQPLKQGFRKEFAVGAVDRDPPDPATWKIAAPKSGSRDPLRITFPEPMDHALAQRVVQVVDSAGRPVPGEVALEQQEKHWSLVPSQNWTHADFVILVQTTIEDLAGNNIGKRFEVDTFERVERRFTNATIRLPLHIH